ncbi:hypothetical protein [Sphaerothrix gracilis]|uniref:hypothetical protein n=1 Tax=Sphaerothrix gracilis TaxID=3151835 RepID=UPI0031FDD580
MVKSSGRSRNVVDGRLGEYGQMKGTLSTLLLVVMTMCNACSDRHRQVSAKGEDSNACPDEPLNVLEGQYVKRISFDEEPLHVASGQVNVGKARGFAFEAEQGSLLSYSTQENICVWLYTPTGELNHDNKLPVSGIYTIQVATIKGSTSFTLEMSLRKNEPQQTEPNRLTSQNSSTQSTDVISQSVEQNINPQEFVQDYFANLNDRNYSYTWEALSSDFQAISESFEGYTDWWNSVDKIVLNSTKVVSQSGTQAVVDAELRYVMNTGTVANDDYGRIYLQWNTDKGNWEIFKKTAP